MKTYLNEKEPKYTITIPYPSNLKSNQKLKIHITGLNVERSFEDRDIFISLSLASDSEESLSLWIRGEDGIAIGQAIISASAYALKANMINHQNVHMQNALDKFISENRVKEIILKRIDINLVNYGSGFALYNIKPIWNDNMAPEYQEDFNYDTVLYGEKFNMKFNNIPYKIKK